MVNKTEKILFASDLGEGSRHAFQYASSVATRFGATMVLLHVVEKLPQGVEQRLDLVVGKGTADTYVKAREQEARAALIGKRNEFYTVNQALADFYGAQAAADSQVFDSFQVEIREGRAPETIIEVAEQQKCDLIVLGGHKGFLGRAAIGSVAKHVLQHSKVPVVIVPLPEQP